MKASIDFEIFYKKKYSSPAEFIADKSYDLFISAYNDSERVKTIFEGVLATKKHWLVFPEYCYRDEELPLPGDGKEIFRFNECDSKEEGDIIRFYLGKTDNLLGKRICIDITGFIRPHLIFLVRYLSSQDLGSIDFIYTDPIKYKKKEHTSFSLDYTDVRQINGYQGLNNSDRSNDLLIIGSGYDDQRITDVSKKKSNAKKVQVFGFPSLQPDMFQENILKAYKAEEASSGGRDLFIDPDLTLFAPANDPFVTANVIKEFVDQENKREPITNLYLCPLSTKAQTLGFALYYLAECLNKTASIIFPFCDRYSRETTEGVAKIWKYSIDLKCLVK